MNNNLTEVVFIVDESGSMFNLQDDTIGGINSFIEQQKKEPGDARFTLVKFSSSPKTVYWRVPINEVEPLTAANYSPGGCTALYDAVGSTIDRIGFALAETPEPERPGHVIFVITTDGYENASHQYSGSQLREMVPYQKVKYSWDFLFLGADIDAFAAAKDIGISADRSASYANTKIGTETMYNVMTKTVANYRASGTVDADWMNGLVTNDCADKTSN